MVFRRYITGVWYRTLVVSLSGDAGIRNKYFLS